MLNKQIGVYQLFNIINNKIYVGSSIDLNRRKQEHFRLLHKNKHPNTYLQNAWNKYGEDNFRFIVLETTDDISKIRQLEQKWLDETKCYLHEYGYNMLPKADSPLGYKHSEETKEKRSLLTKEEIKDIKLLRRDTDLTYESIGNIFNVSSGVVTNIIFDFNLSWVKINDSDELDVQKYAKYIDSFGGRLTHRLKSSEIKEIKFLLENNIKQVKVAELFDIKQTVVSDIKCMNIHNNVLLSDKDRVNLKTKFRDILMNSENNPKKMTDEKVKNIKVLLNMNYSPSYISKIFNVARGTIHSIKSNKYWKHIKVSDRDELDDEYKKYLDKSKIIIKLSEQEVKEIKIKLKEGYYSHRELGKQYGVSKSAIQNIDSGNSYSGIEVSNQIQKRNIYLLKNRNIELNHKTSVYRNLNKGELFSIKDRGTGLVLAHGSNFKIESVKCHVGNGRHRVREEKTKNVHAWLNGIYTGECEMDILDMVELYYDPYTLDTFINKETGEPIHSVDLVYFSDGKAWILKEV